MNERIKELAEQNSENLSNVVRNDEWLEKFADLIVQECVQYIEYQLQVGGYKADMLKRHFGGVSE